jgi:hypothetical protein
LRTNRIPKGRLMKKVKIKEERIMGINPLISPGRIFRKNRENLKPIRETGKSSVTR